MPAKKASKKPVKKAKPKQKPEPTRSSDYDSNDRKGSPWVPYNPYKRK
jgi:hypothetical protein